MKDKIIFITGRVVQNIAEDASARLGGSARGYVFISPRAPENIHSSLLMPLSLIDELLKLFARLEIGDAFCGDRDGLAGFGVASLTRISLTYPKAAKAAKLDLFAFIKAAGDAVKDY